MSRLDERALLDDFFHFLPASAVMGLLEQVDGAAIQREMVPLLQYGLLSGVKTLFGLGEHAGFASLAVQC